MTGRQWRRIGMIGCGAIGSALAEILAGEAGPGQALTTVLLKPGRDRPKGLPPTAEVVHDVDSLVHTNPDVVVECAGQAAVRDCALPILEAEIDLVLIATGALVDDSLFQDLGDAAERSGARLHLPAGAIAGIDGLAALRLGGLATVTYSSTKPPEAWRGTPAEEVVDLASLREPTVFFTGTAREAARRYPRNANLAATVALAGIGFDRTQIHLIADPRATGNAGRIEAEGRDGTLDVTFAGRAAVGNPKTSASTALSLARTLLNADSAIVI